MKDKIIEIIKSQETYIRKANRTVLFEKDYDFVAQEIVKLFVIPDVSGSIRTDVYGEIHKSDEYIDGDQDCGICKYYNTKIDLLPCSKCELGESEYYR